MTAQQLKNSILQMAVQGKLVPQDPNDEPASILLQRIKAEKQELIKAGKIKKDKKSSEIFRGATHNLPYAFCEQIGNEIRDISDEIPFEIPDSWEWVRFSNLVNFSMGKTPPRKETEYWENPIYPWVSIADMPADGTVLSTKEKVNQYAADNTFKSGISPIGTLIMSFKLTVGKVSILGIDAYHNEAIISIFPFVDDDRIVTSYLFKVLPLIAQNGDTKTAIKGATLNSDSLSNLLIPLPPLTEQKRIVNRIVELEPYVSAYDIAENHLTALNTTFPEALKKSILQEAVQGKLVPQNPDDEPASVLLERIRAEKQELIKQGKIKQNKNESVIITRDKIPYEIPDSWVWCKLSDLAILENGDRSSKYPVEADYVEIGIPFFGAKDIDGDMMSFQNVRFISQQKYDELGNGKLVDGDIICLLRGSVGKTAKFEANEQFDTGFICAQMLIIRLLDKSLFGYISSYFKSPDYTNYVESKVTGTAVRQMPAKEMGNLLIPLPPLAEQHRIVAKIEEIMPMIERLTLR
jgi:type I restriction enzyme S subunit